MPAAASWSAGRAPGRCPPTWPWRPWRWPAGPAGASWMGWCITRTGAIAGHPLHRTPGRGGSGYLGGLPRGLVRQRLGRDDHRPVQGRADPPPGPMAGPGRGRGRHLGVGRLVQPPPPLGAIGHLPPAELEATSWRRKLQPASTNSSNQASGEPGRFRQGPTVGSSVAHAPERLAACYSFLHFPQGRPCGRPPPAAVLGRQRCDGQRDRLALSTGVET